MNFNVRSFKTIGLLALTYGFLQCAPFQKAKNRENKPNVITVEAENFVATSGSVELMSESNGTNSFVKTKAANSWMTYLVAIPKSGRYQVNVYAKNTDNSPSVCWIEDYADNKDSRCYNITGNMLLSGTSTALQKQGFPLTASSHLIKFHSENTNFILDKIEFVLIQDRVATPKVITSNTSGKNWKLLWSDEFNGKGLPDQSKWTYDFGDWGWGNNELQFYTDKKIQNARQENGNLIIEAIRNKDNANWTSARLTTRGKQSFLYGKIEFRAKVPSGKGTWAAGWLLGDAYQDEISWPYCGEVDVLENVGYEINPTTGNGINHASVHCGAYYFKLGNQITATTEMNDMTNTFHDYTVEWLPNSLIIYVDGKKYFEYKDTKNDLTWPYNKPQNIILNLAMGGGMGKEVDPSVNSQKFIIDYVRVYELR